MDTSTPVLTTGLGVSPGRVSGRVVLSSEAAAEADGDVILVRPETSPEDVAGMSVSVGILTTTGGLVSHAAVVARGWGIPAVVGAHDLTVAADGVRDATGSLVMRAGDVITIDGTSGQTWLGDVTDSAAVDPELALSTHLPELARLEAWAAHREK